MSGERRDWELTPTLLFRSLEQAKQEELRKKEAMKKLRVRAKQ
jgi:hypothetical protein